MIKLEVDYDIVFIIDCLLQKDRVRHSISEDLIQYLANNGVRHNLIKCDNKKMLLDSFDFMNTFAESGEKFCLHIVSHGTEEGLWIELTNEYIYWDELRTRLYEINTKLDNTLTINMTSCKGLNGIRIVDENKETKPFFALVGCNRDLFINEAKLANTLFYSKLLEGKDVSLTIIPEIQKEFKNLGKSDNVIYGISALGYQQILKRQTNSSL